MKPILTIGQVASTARVTAGTIRYYESLGLLPEPPRTPAGYRHYTPSVVHRLAVIRSAKEFGFSLRQIASFLGARDNGGTPCQAVRQAADLLLTDVETQIAALRSKRRRMARMLKRWDQRLMRTPSGGRAHLLEMLTRSHPA